MSTVKDQDNKKISIVGTNTRFQLKKVTQNKQIKVRSISNTWKDIPHMDNQVKIIESLHKDSIDDCGNNEYACVVTEINNKINGYKHQDILKGLYNSELFVSYNQVINQLNNCKLTCYYCSSKVLVLYSIVREPLQWSLDRINNDDGHTNENVVISCLKCNLERKRRTKDAFVFTKKMIITRIVE
jgi:hypothetical protein